MDHDADSAVGPRLGRAASSLHKSDEGQALPIALLALAIGVILVTVFAAAVATYMQFNSSSATELLDYYTADAGIEQAIAPLAGNPSAYTSNSALTLSLNNRSASVSVAPLGSQSFRDVTSGTDITTTVTSYLVTSASGSQTITSRVEARKTDRQAVAQVRITAWRAGR
jgi:hypothetical protein